MMTDGYPYVIRDGNPVRFPQSMPMVGFGNRHTAELPNGVAYPSYDGLVELTASGANLITSALYAPDDWHKLPAGPLRRAFEVAHGEAGE